MTALLEIENLSKTFDGTQVLRDVSLSVGSGEVHALVGANGSGKSTLIKLLAGFYRPDSGSRIRVSGEELRMPVSGPTARAAGLRFVHQDAPLVGTLSVLENLAMTDGYEQGFGRHIRWKSLRRRAASLLERFEVDLELDRNVDEISAAERMMLCIAREAGDADWEQRILVLDEPTAALASHESERLFQLIETVRATGAGVLYVSHRFGEVFRLADNISVLRDGDLIGTYGRGKLDQKQLMELMIGEPESEAYPRPPSRVGGGVALDLDRVSGTRLVDFSCQVHEGEVVGVYGLLGCGKSELGRIVAGVQPARGGTVKVGATELPSRLTPRIAMANGICYVPQNRREGGLIESLTVGENLVLTDLDPLIRHRYIMRGKEEREVDELISRFGIVPPDPSREVATLSGGNQQKIVLAKWLRKSIACNVLVADEPTAGVDVHAKRDIYQLLDHTAAAGAGVLVLSSEAEEVALICHRAIVLREGVAVAELSGPELTREAVISAASYSAPPVAEAA